MRNRWRRGEERGGFGLGGGAESAGSAIVVYLEEEEEVAYRVLGEDQRSQLLQLQQPTRLRAGSPWERESSHIQPI